MEYMAFDAGFGDQATAIRESAMQFAVEIMRPVARELDSMSDPRDVVAEASKIRGVIKAYREMGFHRVGFPEELSVGPDGIEPIVRSQLLEALGYGDAGLAIGLSTDSLPFEMAALSGSDELVELARAYSTDTAAGLIGCWIDLQSKRSVNGGVIDNNDVIQGCRTGWVANGSIATHALVTMASIANENPLLAVIPLDLPGVSRGDALEKMGLRSLNQCQIVLDQLKIPQKYFINSNAVAEMASSLVQGSIGQIAVGLAQAAFDESIAYANKRIQGGVPIVRHNNIRLKLFKMFAAIQSGRALARSLALNDSMDQGAASRCHSIALRVIATEAAFKVTSETIQVFGGNGLIKTYPVEKLMRDAGTLMNINGTNETLSLEAARNL